MNAEALAVAVQDRRAHLVRCVAMYETRGWTDLAAEYRVRLDELDRLLLFANVAEMSEPAKCPADYLGAPGCICKRDDLHEYAAAR
jgi:hypothetical protein